MPALQAFVDGVVIPASQLTQRDPLFAVMSADQTVNNSATFVNSALVVTVAPSATYECHLHFVFNSGATPSLKTQFTAPAGATGPGWTFFLPNASNLAVENVCTLGAVGGITCTGSDQPGDYFGLLTTGANGGAFQFQWAQQTANASNSIVRANSYLHLRQVA